MECVLVSIGREEKKIKKLATQRNTHTFTTLLCFLFINKRTLN